jgi:hypothetical protein
MPEEMDQKYGYVIYRLVVRCITGLNLENYVLVGYDKRWCLIFIVSSEQYQLLVNKLCPSRHQKKGARF